ncbi:hypothetical protein DV736_g626, partial [Chaetothyriales sp. CBS 134916]
MPPGVSGPGSLDTSVRILQIAKLAYPAIILCLFVVCFAIHGITTAPEDEHRVEVQALRGPGGRPLPVRRISAREIKEAAAQRDCSPKAKLVFRIAQGAVIATFIADAVIILLQVLIYRKEEWWPGQGPIVFVVGSFFAWMVVMISLIDTKPSPSIVHLVVWLTAIPLELIIIGASLYIYTNPHHEPKVGDQQGGKYREGMTAWEAIEMLIAFCRFALLCGMAIVFLIYRISTRWNRSRDSSPRASERTPLLSGGQTKNHTQSNGHLHGHDVAHRQQESNEHPAAWAKPTETPSVTWYQYLRGFVVLIPYLWPKKSVKLQILAGSCMLIMISQRVINVFVPIMTGKITDALSGDDGRGIRAPWLYILLYVIFRWLQGSQGILSAARTILWIPVEQYSYRAISTAAFEHVHGLSAEFHTGKRTGELISALNKGSSINSFLELVTFSVGPMIFDLIVAVVYLTISFDIYLGLVVAITTVLYIYVTIRLASWRVKLRRDYVNADREMEAVKNDSLHSWDTVKYFNAEGYEFGRYRTSIKTMQKFEYWVQVTLAYMNTIQGALFMLALLIACFIEAYQVATGYQTVGRFVMLITYMAQLQAPLNFFGTFYRTIQNNLINSERMLELFKEQPIVADSENATEMKDCKGDITFEDVTFSYDSRRDAAHNLSFHCAAGTTTALVGESGGGKSTVMRLIFRYYNPSSGRILVDGRDVQDITIDSLRSNIGVVPQDCNMFNESIFYNLRYANQNASKDDIFEACKAASIHERILAFPDGYNTKVGERGVRLSGGERQRVAIARTILKNPRITLLDEATAALDTETEEKIQQSFASLAHGRTMIIIAHRLSTIVNADQILVLHGGTVVERGTHEELLKKEGRYASMWRKQSRAEKAQAEAEELRTRARKKVEEAEADSANVSEDEHEVRRMAGEGIVQIQRTPRGIGHKRVNFSQSSLGRVWNGDDRGGDDDGGSGKWLGGRPGGHP